MKKPLRTGSPWTGSLSPGRAACACLAGLLAWSCPIEARQTGGSDARSRTAPAQTRTCETPGPLLVESILYRTHALYVYVPATTHDFTLGLKWRNSGAFVQKAARFRLFSPDGQEIEIQPGAPETWSAHPIPTRGVWGIWQLRVEAGQPAPQPGVKSPLDAKSSARTVFSVRTTGDVDLFVRPNAGVGYRGALPFTVWQEGSTERHRFVVQVPRLKRLRLNFRLPEGTFPYGVPIQVEVQPPDGVQFEQRWAGMTRARQYEYEFWRLEYLELTSENLEGRWTVTMNNVSAGYRIGCEQGLPFIFSDSPLIPPATPVRVRTLDAATGAGIAARLEVSSPQTVRARYWGMAAMELPQVAYTTREGVGDLLLMPGPDYTVKASRGPAYEPASLALRVGRETSIELSARTRLPPGWYSGDDHIHTVYSDGSSTPLEVVQAALAEGLDWITVTDHSSGPDNTHAKRAHEEASQAGKELGLLVIPGEEFTSGDVYHANVINGMVELKSDVGFKEVIDAVRGKSSDRHPITVKWNHPGNGAGVPVSDLQQLPLIEMRLRDAGNSDTMQLWWRLLNQGVRVFAESSSDSHSASATPLGDHRTYVHLGAEPLTAGNVVRALAAGRGFVSRGPLLFLKVNGALPGSTAHASSGALELEVEVASRVPLARVEIVRGGSVVHTLDLKGQRTFSTRSSLPGAQGWYLARVIGEGASSSILAMTNPVFVE
jgi:hypothetical protein